MKKFLLLMSAVLIIAGCQEQVTPVPTQQTQTPTQTQETTDTTETQDTEDTSGTTDDDEVTNTAPDKPALTANSWQWVNAGTTDGTIVKPLKPTSFILKFNEDGTMTSTTDCNSLSASYTVNRGQLTLGTIAATKKFCASNSQEGQYLAFLAKVDSFMISRGDLILMFKMDTGTMEFQKNPLSNPNL